jgi:hypothetical protein
VKSRPGRLDGVALVFVAAAAAARALVLVGAGTNLIILKKYSREKLWKKIASI